MPSAPPSPRSPAACTPTPPSTAETSSTNESPAAKASQPTGSPSSTANQQPFSPSSPETVTECSLTSTRPAGSPSPPTNALRHPVRHAGNGGAGSDGGYRVVGHGSENAPPAPSGPQVDPVDVAASAAMHPDALVEAVRRGCDRDKSDDHPRAEPQLPQGQPLERDEATLPPHVLPDFRRRMVKLPRQIELAPLTCRGEYAADAYAVLPVELDGKFREQVVSTRLLEAELARLGSNTDYDSCRYEGGADDEHGRQY